MGESKFGQVSKLDIFVSLVVQSDQGRRLSERLGSSAAAGRGGMICSTRGSRCAGRI